MKSRSIKEGDIEKEWLVLDVADMPVGRAATQIAYVLRGKHKPSFVSHLDIGDNVIVVNAGKLRFTGNKATQKFYYRYTNFIGGLKSKRADEMLDEAPERVLENAVKGMLPHNKLGRRVLKNLRIYGTEAHGQEAQKPKPFPERLVGRGN